MCAVGRHAVLLARATQDGGPMQDAGRAHAAHFNLSVYGFFWYPFSLFVCLNHRSWAGSLGRLPLHPQLNNGARGVQLAVHTPLCSCPAYYREKGLVVLRPLNFLQRDSHFVMRNEGNSQSFVCLRVPLHLRTLHWTQLLLPQQATQLTDVLVLHSSRVKHVLSKFEPEQFIHTYWRTGSGGEPVLLFELPRYGLEFAQYASGTPAAVTYSGYHLAKSQQLVSGSRDGGDAQYTLPNFQQYLVLQLAPSSEVAVGVSRAKRMVLMRVGSVLAPAEGLAKIQVSDATGAILKVRLKAQSTTPSVLLMGLQRALHSSSAPPSLHPPFCVNLPSSTHNSYICQGGVQAVHCSAARDCIRRMGLQVFPTASPTHLIQ